MNYCLCGLEIMIFHGMPRTAATGFTFPGFEGTKNNHNRLAIGPRRKLRLPDKNRGGTISICEENTSWYRANPEFWSTANRNLVCEPFLSSFAL